MDQQNPDLNPIEDLWKGLEIADRQANRPRRIDQRGSAKKKGQKL